MLKEVKKYWNKLESENLDMCLASHYLGLKNNNFKFKYKYFRCWFWGRSEPS